VTRRGRNIANTCRFVSPTLAVLSIFLTRPSILLDLFVNCQPTTDAFPDSGIKTASTLQDALRPSRVARVLSILETRGAQLGDKDRV
jgi:hypothetical protein